MLSTVTALSFIGLLASGSYAIPLNTTNAKTTTPHPILTTISGKSEPELLNALSQIADSPAMAKATVQNVTTVSQMSTSQASSYAPYTHLAAAGYCSTASVSSWSCGQHCNALPGFVTYASGGNNQDVPDWFVGYLPSLSSAVVVHQGTTPSSFESDLVDANFFLTGLGSNFPGISSSVQVHNGFVAAHGKTFPAILAAVKKIFSAKAVKKVTVVGHSLGGAIAVLDGMSLKQNIAGSSVKVVTYGQPRVGNQAFADWVDANIPDNTRITHNGDVVPILPGRFLGFHHSSGEKHIHPKGAWWACQGQDNTADPMCSTGEVANIFEGSIDDHDGPYDDGILIGC